MMQSILAYFTTALIFLGIDYIWLGYIARRLYVAHIGDLLLERPNMVAAAIFYATYVVGIVIFAVAPALRQGNISHALIYGALFGFFCYATYDMTNYATLKGWSLQMSLIDVAWGTILTGTSATLGFMATRYILPS